MGTYHFGQHLGRMSKSCAFEAKMERIGRDDNILKCTCIPSLACCLAPFHFFPKGVLTFSNAQPPWVEPRYVKGVADEPVDSFENCVQLIEHLD